MMRRREARGATFAALRCASPPSLSLFPLQISSSRELLDLHTASQTYHSPSPSPLPPSRTVTPVWGDPSPLSRARRRRADALSRALVACLCAAVLCAPVLQWWTA